MSMMPAGQNGPDEIEFELKAKAALDELEDDARKIGLYVDSAHVMPDPQGSGEMVFMVDFMLGDVAFSDRVQNPEQYGSDQILRGMEAGMQRSDFEETREKMIESLKNGGSLDSFLDEPEDLGN